MKYVFKSENGCCPRCIAFGKVYFIQDRYLGGDDYEYALMSRSAKRKPPMQFAGRKELVSWLVNDMICDDITANLLLSHMTLDRCSHRRMIENNGKKYVWDDESKKLWEYEEPSQETGFCETYLECLNMAKEILRKKERENAGIQLSLFD